VVSGEDPAASQVLFTLRTQKVKAHKGQVSFPGGVYETGDHDLLQTALRETEEETGIAPESLTLAGMLRPYATLTGFLIHPFVGLLPERPALKIQRQEIEKSFYVPLGYLCDPASVDEMEIDWDGFKLQVKAYRWKGMIFWGATFNMLVDLTGRINRIKGFVR
jgi:8-oxo-dGTP pyrophosphatase MutT (NUDIX family)